MVGSLVLLDPLTRFHPIAIARLYWGLRDIVFLVPQDDHRRCSLLSSIRRRLLDLLTLAADHTD